MFFLYYPKTAYDMRLSDCSSDVCSSDLQAFLRMQGICQQPHHHALVGFRGVARHGQPVAAVVMAIAVGDMQVGLKDGSAHGHEQIRRRKAPKRARKSVVVGQSGGATGYTGVGRLIKQNTPQKKT